MSYDETLYLGYYDLLRLDCMIGLSERHPGGAGSLVEDKPMLDSIWRVSSYIALK